jgi:hypothetical protein
MHRSVAALASWRGKYLFPRVLRATAFALAALSPLAARLLRKTAALIPPPGISLVVMARASSLRPMPAATWNPALSPPEK